MLPIPKHLQSILKPIGTSNTEFHVTGEIICPCGHDNFKVKIVGDDSEYNSIRVIRVAEIEGQFFLIVKLQCNHCNKEHLIFDNDYHGWNGFVCGGDSKESERPETKTWPCDKCGSATHAMQITIQSEGQEDFVDEAGDDFDPKDWAEGFSWITMKTTCKTCAETNDEWISYETM